MVKHTQTMRRLLPANCLSMFDHFVGQISRIEKSHALEIFRTDVNLRHITCHKDSFISFKGQNN